MFVVVVVVCNLHNQPDAAPWGKQLVGHGQWLGMVGWWFPKLNRMGVEPPASHDDVGDDNDTDVGDGWLELGSRSILTNILIMMIIVISKRGCQHSDILCSLQIVTLRLWFSTQSRQQQQPIFCWEADSDGLRWAMFPKYIVVIEQHINLHQVYSEMYRIENHTHHRTSPRKQQSSCEIHIKYPLDGKNL